MRQIRQLSIKYRFWLRHASNLACGGAVLFSFVESPFYIGGLLAVLALVLHAAASVQRRGEISPMLTADGQSVSLS